MVEATPATQGGSKKGLAIIIAMILVLVLAGGLYLMNRQNTKSATVPTETTTTTTRQKPAARVATDSSDINSIPDTDNMEADFTALDRDLQNL